MPSSVNSTKEGERMSSLAGGGRPGLLSSVKVSKPPQDSSEGVS